MSPRSPSFSSTNSCLQNSANNIKVCNLSTFNDYKIQEVTFAMVKIRQIKSLLKIINNSRIFNFSFFRVFKLVVYTYIYHSADYHSLVNSIQCTWMGFVHRGYYTVARRYEFYFEWQDNILRTSAASE